MREYSPWVSGKIGRSGSVLRITSANRDALGYPVALDCVFGSRKVDDQTLPFKIRWLIRSADVRVADSQQPPPLIIPLARPRDELTSVLVHGHAFKQLCFRSTATSCSGNVCSPLVVLCPPLGDFFKSALLSANSRGGTDVKAAEMDAVDGSSDNSIKEVEFPIKLPEVALVTEQSQNFGLNTTFDTQWSNLTPNRTTGFIFHPRTRKFYSVAFYHQMHCLNALRKYVAKGQPTCTPNTLRTC